MTRSTLTTWDAPETVKGFVRSPANHTLLQYAGGLRRADGPVHVLDIGCGAGRNAVPLARAGFFVKGTELSWPMLRAAAARGAAGRLHPALAPTAPLPVTAPRVHQMHTHGLDEHDGTRA